MTRTLTAALVLLSTGLSAGRVQGQVGDGKSPAPPGALQSPAPGFLAGPPDRGQPAAPPSPAPAQGAPAPAGNPPKEDAPGASAGPALTRPENLVTFDPMAV